MGSQARQRLSDDHQAVGEVLTQLLTALSNEDVQVSYSKLDLLWARLAVHIRAEHLHLFPAVVSRLIESGNGALSVSKAQSMVDSLRSDHEFFMRELARSIEILRTVTGSIDRSIQEAGLIAVGDAVRAIEKRLELHNEIEENQIYRWSTTILTEPEQNQLARQINAELENHPPRFSAEAWANQ